MNNFQIETAQNVTLNQNVANLSTRIGAYIIDALIISVYYLIIILAFNAMNLDFIESWAIGLIFNIIINFDSQFLKFYGMVKHQVKEQTIYEL